MARKTKNHDIQRYLDSIIGEENGTGIPEESSSKQNDRKPNKSAKGLKSKPPNRVANIKSDSSKHDVENDDNSLLVERTKTTTRRGRRKNIPIASIPVVSTENLTDAKKDVKKKVVQSTISSLGTIQPKPPNTSENGNVVYEFNEVEETSAQVIDNDNKEDLKDLWPVVIVNAADENNTFKCPNCTFTTRKKYLLSRHIKSHGDERPFACTICGRRFKNNFILQSHVNVHLGVKPYACKDCTKSFTTNGELTRHTRYIHTGEKPHKCSECDYATVEMSKLRRHMRSHTGERPYQCPHCTYASPDTFKLKRHVRTHTGEKPYECEICQARFTQSNSLKSHRLIHNVGEKPVFKCSYCPTTCGRKRDLYTHVLKLHNTDKPISCKKCGQESADRYSYKLHIRSHQGEKCYRCRYCPYASVIERHVESHMLIHTDEKPFVCDECKLSFRQMQLLKRHINLYHNKDYVRPPPKAKEHSCPKCPRSFTHKGNLMRHMQTHDPESKVEEEKYQLKIGRKMRVLPDGTICGPSAEDLALSENIKYYDYKSDNDYDENPDDPIEETDYIDTEEAPIEDELDDIDEKPILLEIEEEDEDHNIKTSITKTIKIKKETTRTDSLSDDGDGTNYLIYTVISEDEEEEEPVYQHHIPQIKKNINVKSVKEMMLRKSIK